MIVADLEDQFYGAKTYRVVDLGGHVWSFSQHVRDVPLKEAGEKIGLTVELIPRS
jgi:hypothetical protein